MDRETIEFAPTSVTLPLADVRGLSARPIPVSNRSVTRNATAAPRRHIRVTRCARLFLLRDGRAVRCSHEGHGRVYMGTSRRMRGVFPLEERGRNAAEHVPFLRSNRAEASGSMYIQRTLVNLRSLPRLRA